MKDDQLIEQVATKCWGWSKEDVDGGIIGVEEFWNKGNGEYLLTSLYNPLSNTTIGKGQAIELAEKYSMDVDFEDETICVKLSTGMPSGNWIDCTFGSRFNPQITWQRAVCEIALIVAEERKNEKR